MIINNENSELLKKHQLFIHPSMKLLGHGFLGFRSEFRTSIAGNVGPFGVIHDCFIGSYVSITDGYCYNISVGNYSSLAEGFFVLPNHDISRITTSRCTVATEQSSPHFANFQGKAKYTFSYHTMIGHDVWIGADVKLKNGIVIGHGAVIGAGAVVTKNVPPYAIVAGSPAKIIKMRFPENDVERLLKSQWFNYDWQNIEIDWGDMHNSLSQMEEHIAAKDVPLLGDGFSFKTQGEQIQLQQANWTLDRQAKVSYGTESFLEVFELPIVKQKLLQV